MWSHDGSSNWWMPSVPSEPWPVNLYIFCANWLTTSRCLLLIHYFLLPRQYKILQCSFPRLAYNIFGATFNLFRAYRRRRCPVLPQRRRAERLERAFCVRKKTLGRWEGERSADLRVQLIDKRRAEKNGGVRQMCTWRRKQGGGRGRGTIQR